MLFRFFKSAIKFLVLFCGVLSVWSAESAIASASSQPRILRIASFVGTNGTDVATSIAIDGAGSVYIGGASTKASVSGKSDGFVSKLSAAGQPLYTTYIGGGGDDSVLGLVVDKTGRVYVTGNARSVDLPTTPGALQRSLAGDQDVFFAVLDSAGEIEYSTFLGGSAFEAAGGVALDNAGNVYIAGQTASADFPVTSSGTQTTLKGPVDAFIVKLTPERSVAYATFLGGPGEDVAHAVATDATGNLFVAGFAADGFPTTPGAYRSAHSVSGSDAFVTKLDSNGALVYATYLGAGATFANAVAVDSVGRAIAAGGAAPGLAVTDGAAQRGYGGGLDAFVARLGADGSRLDYASYLGGSRYDEVTAIAVGSGDSIIVGGRTGSPDFPTTRSAVQTLFAGGPSSPFADYSNDAFVVSLDADGQFLFSTLYGGYGADSVASIAVGPNERLLVTGSTQSSDLPVTGGSTFNGGPADAFVAVLDVASASDDPRVVEYYDPDLDHFFITANAIEQAFVDTGGVGKWLRTGNVFVSSGPDAVCRFYGNGAIDPATGAPYGPNSHFYTANAAECSGLKQLYSPTRKSWKFEGNDFTSVASVGACNEDQVPVYRAYNDGYAKNQDSNHRITANRGAYLSMIAKGWIGEGVVMCSQR